MLMSPDTAECLDAFCADSNLPSLQLADAQDHRGRITGIVASWRP